MGWMRLHAEAVTGEFLEAFDLLRRLQEVNAPTDPDLLLLAQPDTFGINPVGERLLRRFRTLPEAEQAYRNLLDIELGRIDEILSKPL